MRIRNHGRSVAMYCRNYVVSMPACQPRTNNKRSPVIYLCCDNSTVPVRSNTKITPPHPPKKTEKPGVSDPHGFQCGSRSSILGQCGSRRIRILIRNADPDTNLKNRSPFTYHRDVYVWNNCPSFDAGLLVYLDSQPDTRHRYRSINVFSQVRLLASSHIVFYHQSVNI